VDHRADIFALGVIVYELLTGKKPFAGDNISTIVYKIVNEEPQHITDINRELPRGYEDVIKRALAKNPDERYQSGRAMMADLEDPDKFAEATRAYGAGTAEPEKTPAGKRWRFALAGGLLVFAVLAVVGYQLLSRGGGTSKAGGPVSKSVKRGEISPGTRPESPPLPPAISRAEENLAKLKASFEHKNYDETVDLAKKMLGEDPTDAAAREYRDKALEARLADQVAPILEAGIADYDSGRYQACVDGMERVLKLDKNNAKARDYLNRADSAVSRKDIEALLEEHRAAEESQELLTIINHLASPALVSEAQSQYKDWFNGYDGITSRTGDLSVSFRDRWNATATFTQWVMGTGRKDRKKTMLFSGQKSWDLKKANGSWKIVNIR
jgi:tetratricopeptide (TPR) repeat protein